MEYILRKLIVTILLYYTSITPNSSQSLVIHRTHSPIQSNKSTQLFSLTSNHYQNIQVASTCRGGSDPDRPNKVNQDAYFIQENLANIPYLTLFGVMDGHGKQGHLLNSFLSQRIPQIIEEKLKSFISDQEHGDNDWSLNEMGNILIESYEEVNEEARLDPNVPAGRSGTTCVSCIFDTRNGILLVANVGDSRAIIGLQDDNDKKWIAIEPLTIETTTKLEMERERIELGEGRIDSNGNVWYGPVGIAMTRCLGNVAMHRAGVIHTPIITTINIDEFVLKYQCTGADYSCLILLGTDGIFDVLSNEKVLDIVENEFQKTGSLQSSSDSLVVESKKRWQADLPFEVKVDDTTCAILRFDCRK